MSVDFASAAPGLMPAAVLAGGSVSSSEQPPQVRHFLLPALPCLVSVLCNGNLWYA